MINLTINPDAIKETYKSNMPFPNIIIDNFLEEEFANECLKELEKEALETWNTDHHEDQVNKFWMDKPHILPKRTRGILYELNALSCLGFLSKLTGIENLIADHSYLGGGVHASTRGGRLGIHADFNIHPQMNLHRRLNLLLFLNKNWLPEWNGNLELWHHDMSRKEKSIEPIFNRAVIFNITDTAFHGVPDMILCPPNRKRFSIATYYYTKDRPDEEKSPFHWAAWQRK